MKNNKFPIFLLIILAVITLLSYLFTGDVKVWWIEATSMFVIVALLALTYKKFKFSNLAYFIIFIWCLMQIIGACYTFENVPFDYVNNLFGFKRNNYDRFAHFTIGVSSFLIAEFVWRKKIVKSIKWAAFFGLIFIMALANLWELIEWIYAEADGGAAGLAFLGSQGDIWDAQKDMLMDTLGAILGCFLFYINYRKQK